MVLMLLFPDGNLSSLFSCGALMFSLTIGCRCPVAAMMAQAATQLYYFKIPFHPLDAPPQAWTAASAAPARL